MSKQEIEIIIEEDGTVKIDAINFEGKSCQNVLDKIKKKIGKIKVAKKKPEFYRQKEFTREKDRI